MKFNCYFFTALMCCLFYTTCGTNDAGRQVPSDTLLNYLAMLSGTRYTGKGSLKCDADSLKLLFIPIDIPALYPDYALYLSSNDDGDVLLDEIVSVGEDEPGKIRVTLLDFKEPRSNPGVFDENFLKNLKPSDLSSRGPGCDKIYTRKNNDFFTGSFPNCSAPVSHKRELDVYKTTVDCRDIIIDTAGFPDVPSSKFRRCERAQLPSSWLEGATFTDVCS